MPILTNEILFGRQRFSEVAARNDIGLVIFVLDPTRMARWINLSDRFWDKLQGWWLRRKGKDVHYISVTPIEFIRCGECSENVIRVEASIKNFQEDIIIDGRGFVHGNGLVRYEIDQWSPKLREERAVDRVHVLVRDLFHRHVHHRTDIPLTAVQANNESDAHDKLFDIYQEKFIDYKTLISEGLQQNSYNFFLYRFEGPHDDCCRAKGEVCYAKSLCDKFRLGYLQMLENIECSFETLREKITFEQERFEHSINMGMMIASAGLASSVFFAELSWGWVIFAFLFLPALRVIGGVIASKY